MARPKERTSTTAFQQKCSAASDKLRKSQAEKLRYDMERLFSDGILSDLTVHLLISNLPLHCCILRARSRSLLDYMMSFSSGIDDGSHISLVNCGRSLELSEIYKAIYTEDKIAPYLRKLETILQEPHTSERLGVNSEMDQKCSENNDKNVYGKTDATAETFISNGKECTEHDYYSIAEKLVQKSFKDAKTVIEREKIPDKSYLVINGDTDASLNKNGDEFTAAHGHNISDVKSSGVSQENGVTTDADQEAKGEESKEPRICRPNSEDEAVSLQALAESVWGTRMEFEACNELGSDLLRMLLEGDTCDYSVLVQGQTIRVHSCVLAARSTYFEAMLGGGWRESEAQQTELEGVSPSAVKQMLLHLYGGVIEVDRSCSLGSLVMLSDMYGMEGLKEVVAFNLNKEFCHFFHRPCSGCISGVPDTLALTLMYNMDVMKDKCDKWINKNFDKVWPTKTFASLPQEVLEFCITSAVKDLALDNVIDVMVECRKLNETTPRLRWSEPIFDMITQLMDAAIEYASQNFVPLVSSRTFRELNQQGIAFNRQPLEDIFGMVIMALSPENACQSYLSLNKWVITVKPKEDEDFSLYSQEFLDFVEYLFKRCKTHLCTYIHQAANTVEWGLLTKDMQGDLMTEANYVCIDDPNKCRVARPKLTSMQKKISTTSPLSLKEYFDRHFGSKEHLQTIGKGNIATYKGQPKSTKGRSPIPSTDDSSKLRKKELTGTSSKVRKQDPKTKDTLPRVTTNKSASGTSSLFKRGKVQGAVSNDTLTDEVSAEKSQSDLCEIVNLPRARSSSAGALTFVPRFGQRPRMRNAQSMESFFDSRQGQTTHLQKPIPLLEVKFVVPHEFFESF